MSGPLDHSPAQVIQRLFISMGLGNLPVPGTVVQWPIFVANQPDTPDNSIAIFDTQPLVSGRRQFDGEITEHYGFQVAVRTIDFPTGFLKCQQVLTAVERTIYRATVTISSSQYLVHSITRKSYFDLNGKDPVSNRSLFTINLLTTLRKTN